jgi:hypothetical protein
VHCTGPLHAADAASVTAVVDGAAALLSHLVPSKVLRIGSFMGWVGAILTAPTLPQPAALQAVVSSLFAKPVKPTSFLVRQLNGAWVPFTALRTTQTPWAGFRNTVHCRAGPKKRENLGRETAGQHGQTNGGDRCSTQRGGETTCRHPQGESSLYCRRRTLTTARRRRRPQTQANTAMRPKTVQGSQAEATGSVEEKACYVNGVGVHTPLPSSVATVPSPGRVHHTMVAAHAALQPQRHERGQKRAWSHALGPFSSRRAPHHGARPSAMRSSGSQPRTARP